MKVRRPLTILAVLAAMLAVPASSQAGEITFGSDLSAPADLVEHHGPDSAFWNVSLPGGGSGAAPADGEVTEVKVKGMVIPDPLGQIKPMTMIHFQVLHPMGDGSMMVMLSSAAFYTPLGGDSQAISTYHPFNLCVRKGDIVDFNDIGGFEWRWGAYYGMPFQTFSRVPSSTTAGYYADNGTNNGSRWKAQELKQGEELLMQTKLSTGPDSTDYCHGGYKQHIFKGLSIRDSQLPTVRTRVRTVKVRATCPGPSYGACRGTMKLVATIKGVRQTIGTKSFSVKPAYSTNVEFKLSKSVVRAIQKARSVQATAIADTRDDPSGDPHARTNDVPVQSKSTSSAMILKADKTLKQTSRKKRRKSR